jgi:hypothetical protein
MATSARLSTVTHLYFQCEDAPTSLIMVDDALFTLPGNVSPWFVNVFGNVYRRPKPVRVHEDDGFPVYYLPIPRAIMVELLRAMRFPTMIPDLLRHVPVSFQKTISLATWRQYLEYYGFVPNPALTKKAAPDAGTLNKRAREKLDTLEALAPFKYVRRIAEALAGELKSSHPDYAKFVNGVKSEVKCDFVNTYLLSAPNYTYVLALPGEPVLDAVNVAWYLGYRLPRDDEFVRKGVPDMEYFKLCFERALGEKLGVSCYLTLNRKSKATKNKRVKEWPATPAWLEPGSYEVCALSFSRTNEKGQTYEEAALLEIRRSLLRKNEDSDDEDSCSD